MKYLVYLIYIVTWDAGILIGTSYIVFFLHQFGWWFLLAVFLLQGCLEPRDFGIGEFEIRKKRRRK